MQKMKRTIEGGGSDLFICFTSRPSAAAASSAAAVRVPSSKSLMSPGRAGAGANPSSVPSLSSSLSRRLRNSGSIKGGQSPMFPSAAAGGGRKKGAAFEAAAEPSSPKVTCIGQVRVKSKKKNKNKHQLVVCRSRSGCEPSFRRCEASASRRRKPVGFCHALRSFGSEINCFVPCGWPACGSGREEGKRAIKRGRSHSSSSSCGAVFARWLMAMEGNGEDEEEVEKGRQLVGLVVEERAGKGEVGLFMRREKEVELDFENLFLKKKEEEEEEKEMLVAAEKEEEREEEEEKGRVSVCVPPRNALLLMRCRSDPVRMAALATRFWDSPAMQVHQGNGPDRGEEVEEISNQEEEIDEDVVCEANKEEDGGEMDDSCVEQVAGEVEEVEKGVVVDEDKAVVLEEEKVIITDEVDEEVEKEVGMINELSGEKEHVSGKAMLAEQPKENIAAATDELGEKEPLAMNEEGAVLLQKEDGGEPIAIVLRRSVSCSVPNCNDFAKVKEGGRRRSFSYREKKKRRHSFSMERDSRRHSFCSEKEARRSSFSIDKEGRRRWSFSVEKENLGPEGRTMVPSIEKSKKEGMPAADGESMKAMEPKIEEKTVKISGNTKPVAADEVRERIGVSKREEAEAAESKKKTTGELPDCLLLMMYEPKLSMEVSKETWVCSTDFLHWRPNSSHRNNQPAKCNVNVNTNAELGANGNAEEQKCQEKCADDKNVVSVSKGNSTVAQPPVTQPTSTVSPVEQKLPKNLATGALPQHFVLTRCKSEPLKSSARLAPESWFWKARHQPIGTAGLGF